MGNFNIDYFELCFLAEVCIPPVPIARALFFDKMIDEYYYQLTIEERKHIFNWIGKRLDESNEKHLIFLKRYDSENQYRIEFKADELSKNKSEFIDAFLYKGKYYTKINRWINPDYIIDVKKIE